METHDVPAQQEPVLEPRPVRAVRLLPLAGFITIGFCIFLFTLATVNARTADELRSDSKSWRSHVVISHWMTNGYFATAGLVVRESEAEPKRPYLYRSSTGAYMLSGLLLQKARAWGGHGYGWHALAVHNQLILMIASVVVALLSFRLALRLGMAPLQAFVLAAVTETVFFTYQGNLEVYWEMSEMLWTLLFGALFLLVEERAAVEGEGRRHTVVRAALAFFITIFSVTTGVFFLVSYAAVRLVALPVSSPKRLLAALLIPAGAACAIYASQLSLAPQLQPALPLRGSSVVLRAGYDGSRAHYQNHSDLLVGRRSGMQQLANDRDAGVRRPWLMTFGLLAIVILLVAHLRRLAPPFTILAVVAFVGTWLLYSAFFSQAVVIHPHLYDPILGLGLALAIFAAAPAVLENATRRTGIFVLLAAFAGCLHANSNLREYAMGQPLPSALPIDTKARRREAAKPTAKETVTGDWKSVPFAADSFAANRGGWSVEEADQTALAHTQLGPKTMMVSFFIQGTDVTGDPRTLQIRIPEGKTAARATGTMCRVRDAGGTLGGGFVMVQPKANVISIQKLDGSAWKNTTTDDTLVFGSITFEIR